MATRTTMKRVLLAAILLASCTAAADANRNRDAKPVRQVTVTNTFASTLVYFYATSTGNAVWGADRLGDAVVLQGDRITTSFTGGEAYCLFDFRAEFANGAVIEDTHRNICEPAAISLF